MSGRKAGASTVVAAVSIVCVSVAFAPRATAQTARPRLGTRVQVTVPSRIGVSIREVGPADVSGGKLPGEFGAYVTEITAGGPAEKSGIRAGDVIVEFDGERVRSAAELERLIRETPAGRAVKVALVRAGKRMDVTVTTEASPNVRDFPFELPQFRDRPLEPLRPYQMYPERPFTLPPRAEGGFVFPGPIPLTPRLGIGVQDLTPQLAEYFRTKEGVLVSSVDGGSPASRAGLKAGDIITSIDGRAVGRADEVRGALRAKRPGDKVTLGILRDGKPRTVTVTL